MTNLKIPQLTKELVDRFWAKVKMLPSGCWEWQAGKKNSGYGGFQIKRNYYAAHRIAYAIYYQKDAGELCVCHVCDNPPCVNPLHLFLGTKLDNTRDRIRKGRSNVRPEKVGRGETHSQVKITEDQVRSIRQRAGNGANYPTLAKDFDLSKSAICLIVQRKRWAHVI